MHYFWQKTGLGYILVEFFTNSSGHPDADQQVNNFTYIKHIPTNPDKIRYPARAWDGVTPKLLKILSLASRCFTIFTEQHSGRPFKTSSTGYWKGACSWPAILIGLMCFGQFLISPLGANWDPRGELCPLGVKLGPGVKTLCSPFHSSKQ
jgi:hypothetical protein